MLKLKTAFKQLEDGFFNLLVERIIANGFTDDKLKDAVSYLLDNFKYKEFNISDIIQFDKRLKLYRYNQMCDLITSHQATGNDFENIKIDGVLFFILKSEKYF